LRASQAQQVLSPIVQEQTLYTMETSIRSIEQQTRIAGGASHVGGVTADDFARLIAQLQ
jgi:hypothetical protein